MHLHDDETKELSASGNGGIPAQATWGDPFDLQLRGPFAAGVLCRALTWFSALWDTGSAATLPHQSVWYIIMTIYIKDLCICQALFEADYFSAKVIRTDRIPILCWYRTVRPAPVISARI